MRISILLASMIVSADEGYGREHGELPATLERLVPGYFTLSVPVDPAYPATQCRRSPTGNSMSATQP